VPKNLETVGLIEKDKTKNYQKNIYYVYKPLEEYDLYSCVPEMVNAHDNKKQKVSATVEQDKVRLQQHNEAKESEKEIKATQIVPSEPKRKMVSHDEYAKYKEVEE
jgi:hypothetical protein